MDRVRLGRALGYGTRHAVRTVAAVVEAASASRGPEVSPTPSPKRSDPVVERPPVSSARPVRTSATVRAAGVGRGLTHLRRSVWGPLALFSGALWLRVTGLFFGLIAFTVGAGAWRLRDGWQRGWQRGWQHALQTPAGTRFWIFVAVAALFAYFAVSSFVRANLKERRAATQRAS